MNDSINEEIIRLLCDKRITSLTAIANGPSIDQAIRRLPRRSSYSVGVHLNLTEFEPLTPTANLGYLKVLLDSRGHFAGEEVLRNVSWTKALREAAFRELCLQVNRIIAYGINISHFDSHNHIHTIPGFFTTLKRLQRHYQIRKVRVAKNIYGPTDPITPARLLKKAVWNCALRYCYRTKTTSGFAFFSEFLDIVKARTLYHGSVELMVHPGHPLFGKDAEMLLSEWQNEIPFKIQLISYHDL